MASTTDQSAIPYPELSDEPNIESAVKPTAEWLDSRIVPRYATTTERDGAIVSPEAGQVCYVATHGMMIYSTAWVPFPGTDIARLVQGATQNLSNASETAITFGSGSQIYLPFGGHSTSSNNTRIVLPFPGRYEASGVVTFGNNTTGPRLSYIGKNGSAIAGSNLGRYTGGVAASCHPSFATFSANGSTDYIELYAYQASGGTLATVVDTGVGVKMASALVVKYLGPVLA